LLAKGEEREWRSFFHRFWRVCSDKIVDVTLAECLAVYVSQMPVVEVRQANEVEERRGEE
jgi:hypothetical protein